MNTLTQEQVNALPEGTAVIVTWSGGNGPHRYTIGVKHDVRYAVLPPMGWREEADPDRRFVLDGRLEGCGDVCPDGKHRFTVVELDPNAGQPSKGSV